MMNKPANQDFLPQGETAPLQAPQKTAYREWEDAAPSTPKAVSDWQSYSRDNSRSLVRGLLLFVLLPTLVSAFYFCAVATPQYQTEMHLSVYSPHASAAPIGIGALLGGAVSSVQSSQDVLNIAEYIRSYEATQKLMDKVDLRAILGFPGADFLARPPENASLEKLHDYYRRRVNVVFNTDSRTVSVYVRAFSPADATALASAILTLSEEAVNGYNARAENDMLLLSRTELARAEERIAQVRGQLTEYRQKSNDIDPASRSGAIMGGISGLEQAYNAAQVELRQLSAASTGDNVQLRAVRRKVAALERQIKQEQQRLTGSGNTYSQKLATYEGLMLEQELAQQVYASALAAFEKAQLEAQRQKSYVVPIVKPHTPQDAEYPERARSIILTFVAALVLFGIGRLLLAGVRDHMMH